jgi:uncharacterized protein (DUF58 family)
MSDGVISHALTTDFCPWANKYVYWLKEPIGWFVMAFATSVLVGLHVTPIGWVLASAILGIITIGMVWPWVAIRAAGCRLASVVAEIHEGQSCDLVFSVRNRLPMPLWGLAIEGYLDREGDAVKPTVALACVPPLSEADYRLAVRPEMRGEYPVVAPMIACSFPFGIWTARRMVTEFSPLMVFPQVSLIQDEATLVGNRMSDCGDGSRAGQMGELLGVRPFRNGDRLRNVHWIHTARTGNLVVCERGGPQQQTVEVLLDTRPLENVGSLSRESDRLTNRNAIAWRVRVAASLVNHLHARHVPVTLRLEQKAIHGSAGSVGLRRMMRELAVLAVDGTPVDGMRANGLGRDGNRGGTPPLRQVSTAHGVQLRVTSDETGLFAIVEDSRGPSVRIDLRADVAAQLLRFWREVDHVRSAA